jgi:hypothetical protein
VRPSFAGSVHAAAKRPERAVQFFKTSLSIGHANFNRSRPGFGLVVLNVQHVLVERLSVA